MNNLLTFEPKRWYRVYKRGNNNIPSKLYCGRCLECCITFVDRDMNQYTFPIVKGIVFDKLSKMNGFEQQQICVPCEGVRIFADDWFVAKTDNLIEKVLNII